MVHIAQQTNFKSLRLVYGSLGYVSRTFRAENLGSVAHRRGKM